jgi:hypothetical protein
VRVVVWAVWMVCVYSGGKEERAGVRKGMG